MYDFRPFFFYDFSIEDVMALCNWCCLQPAGLNLV
jgi:hypothetical protein